MHGQGAAALQSLNRHYAILDKKQLSEQDIRSKYIMPALQAAGRDQQLQIMEEINLTAGQLHARGRLVTRSQPRRAHPQSTVNCSRITS